MAKRRRNKIGQFVSASYMTEEQDLNFEGIFQKVFRLLELCLYFLCFAHGLLLHLSLK